MADLEIRGAGNLLGDRRERARRRDRLRDVLADARGGASTSCPASRRRRAAAVRVDLPVTAYVPPAYIAYEASKIDAHRRIARARSVRRSRRRARRSSPTGFGPRPEPVENLLTLQAIRLKAAELPARRRRLSRGPPAGRRARPRRPLGGARATVDGPCIVYFKQDHSLAAHRLVQDQALLRWVEATLDAILDSRVSPDPSSISGRESL